ncbi:MAG: hypothetical protein CO186_07315 [Zetaproteobacteria bacterium CG_4_9_14_3_um_filter_49_83]|nr:MAG: hypothetical protein AUJ56_06140 [Zetaproteobacteria bacterium CG1_02_49_23]PIQ30154.1 MAG: hypothetical protein COW62_13280 [Zetaproteobacteria bacterium CG17_big_fil_post_rev_8_21_14_2_50_50_13]PIV30383.1 MAG: hypothetical protein COS35_07020 [Zetaproteobacteria bacterium CG02_land_8_20_14_3_00_50_9]PIY54514.1 MAG: hypothetical protein COZ00_14240 [Zetaproteobacteria bacterium CG_4_10_14_0_8_um_filter_49_80]PJA35154.1 MAG: hypothetical protein CO186_07315 [Zetaproteobacteria bacterium
MSDAAKASYAWNFFRSGGFDQVVIESGEDLRHLPELDAKLWASLSCPTQNLELDVDTLKLINSNADGRIRLPEINAAVLWICSVLRDQDVLLSEGSSLPLSAINDESDDGKLLLVSCRSILANQGKADQESIDLADVLDNKAIFGQTRFNGDGIVTVNSAEDADCQRVIADAIATLGGLEDRSGQPGIDAAKNTQFFNEAALLLAWQAEGEADSQTVFPFGEHTDAAYSSFKLVETKVDDYFARCRLAAFDPRAIAHLNCSEPQLAAIGAAMLSSDGSETRDLPLARVEAGKALPLLEGVNPAWIAAIGALHANVVVALFGSKTVALNEAEWLQIKQKLAAYANWVGKKPASALASLGMDRLREILDGDGQTQIAALIKEDLAQKDAADGIISVERLLRYRRDLVTLLHNFVSFADFYDRGRKAVFQAGTLYLDGRSCELCIRVNDVAKHAAMAHLGRMYLAYCECRRSDSAEKMFIAAVFTNGDSDNLMVGRNGVFYDRAGRDWDATIVKIIDHPISIKQAFWSPYKRIGKMIGEQIEKMAAARDKDLQGKVAANIVDTSKKVESDIADKQPFDVGKFAGIFAAIGLAVGAIGTALAALVTGFLSLIWWQMPLALIGVVLAVSLPSMVTAAMKLRQRNLAPLLDANGWAVNSQAKVNISFGRSLTSVAELPEGAQRRLYDPFEDKKSLWPWIVLLVLAAVAVAWGIGWIDIPV